MGLNGPYAEQTAKIENKMKRPYYYCLYQYAMTFNFQAHPLSDICTHLACSLLTSVYFVTYKVLKVKIPWRYFGVLGSKGVVDIRAL